MRLHRLIAPLPYCARAASIHLSFEQVTQGLHSSCSCLVALLSSTIDCWNSLDDPFRSLALSGISILRDKVFAVSLWREQKPPATLEANSLDASRESPFFGLVLTGKKSNFHTDLLRRLPLSEISTAYLEHDNEFWDAVNWDEILASLPRVKELALRHPMPPHLDGSQSYQTMSGDIRSLCPDLRLLHVHTSNTLWIYFPHSITLGDLGANLVTRRDSSPSNSCTPLAVSSKMDETDVTGESGRAALQYVWYPVSVSNWLRL